MTTPTWLAALLAVSVIGFGMIAGFFVTFSDFLMRSLKRSRPASAIEVMQTNNREIFRSVTRVSLWGMLGLSTIASVAAVSTQMAKGPLSLVVLGCVLYFCGVLIVSYARNVPMNNRLASMSYSAAEATRYWRDDYVDRWVFWNTVRAIASLAAAVCFLLAGGCLALGAV